MVKLRATLHVEYEYNADPADYGTSDPEEMAKIDQEEMDPEQILSESDTLTVTVGVIDG